MDFLIAIPLIALGLTSILVFVVLLRSQRKRGQPAFLVFLTSMAAWAGAIYFFRSASDPQHAMNWEKAAIFAVCLMAASFLHFSYLNTKRHAPLAVPIAYIGAGVIGLLSFTSLIYTGVDIDKFGYFPVAGPLFLLVPFHNYLFVTWGMINFIHGYRKSRDLNERNSFLFIILGAICFWAGGFSDVFSTLSNSFAPLGLLGSILFSLLASVAVLRYKLLDLRTAFRKSSAYALVSLLVAVPYAGLVLLASYYLRGSRLEALWYVILFFILALILQPLWRWAQSLVDRLYYSKRYDFLQSLNDFSRQMPLFSNLDETSNHLVKLIASILKAEKVVLLFESPTQKKLLTLASYNYSSPDEVLDISISSDTLLTEWFVQQRHYVQFEEIETIPLLRTFPNTERQILNAIGTRFLVPLVSSAGELIGIIILGGKQDHKLYTHEDLQLVTSIQNQLTMSMENARLYRDLKFSESALRQSENKLRFMFESMAEGIAVIDNEYVILEINQAAANMYGSNKNELIGRQFFSLISRDCRDKLMSFTQDNPVLDKPVMFECQLLTSQGKQFPALLSISMLDDQSGNSHNYVCVSQDISVLKSLESEQQILRDKAEVSSRLASVGEMAAGIAHEINNPLTGVIGFSELLAREDLPAETRDYVRYILEGSNRVKEIVRRLLTFARQTTPYKTRLDVHELIGNTLELRGYVLRTANIAVTTDYESGLPWVSADPGQMQQVFLNLIVNAEYAMKKAHDGGTLTITTRHEDDEVLISFADSGPGMDGETLSRLFQPFFTTKEPGEGTGLGLALSRSIVLDHGGDILVESRPGAGTTFTIKLPVSRDGAEPGEAAGQAKAVTRPSPASSRILVVDDEAPIRALVARILTAQGHQVSEVGNPAEAVASLKQDSYDVILMDIRMPGMSGRELYARLNQADPTVAGRVVVITGDTSDAGTRAFLREHNLPFIAKPFGREQLLEKVNEVLVTSHR